ncbi:MAG TPA: alpha/beta hydrolase [Dehalococcoidia bacterium]|nr:alpha/beta hydrolase [Dehalococcoidia bacterium]
MPIAELNGCPIFYEVRGSGPPLVFAHGGFGGAGTGLGVAAPPWRDPFAERLQVITFDRRSAGRSGAPATPHTMALFADDLRALLRHLGIERAAVMGTSAGGPIVLEFALRHPDALTCLVVTESAPRFFPDAHQRQRLKDRIALLEREGPEAAYAARRTQGTVGLQLFSAERAAADADEEARRAERRAALQSQLAGLSREERIARYAAELRTYAAYADYDATPRLREIQAPTLVINATGDTIFPPSFVDWPALVRGMPNARYVALPGGEHGSVSADQGALDTILDFVLAHVPGTRPRHGAASVHASS